MNLFANELNFSLIIISNKRLFIIFFLNRKHMEIDKAPDPMYAIVPCQHPKHRTPIAILERAEINPECYLLSCFTEL